MDPFFSVAQVIVPIFAAVFLGVYARKHGHITWEGNQGLQRFAIDFGLPCILFNSCLTARIDEGSLLTMGLVLPLVILSTLWAFRRGRKRFAYHNLPMLFAAQETGMIGIPLFMILFGADQAFRVGILDLTQTATVIPTIAVLTADAGKNPTLGQIGKKVIASPFLLASLLGLALNLSGAGDWLNQMGAGQIITGVTSFISQPVSTVMLFSVGYNFSLSKENREEIFRIAGIHVLLYGVFCLLIQGALLLVPNVDPRIRWSIALYCALPPSYLAPGLGRRKEDYAVASGVCSVLTLVCMGVFCCMAAAVV